MPVASAQQRMELLRHALDSPLLIGAAGAFVVGVTGSIHCLLMCGPLACAAAPGTPGRSRVHARIAYQLARVLAYGVMGAALGLAGGGVLSALSVSAQPWLPWIMAAALLASALEVGKRLPPIPGLSRLGGIVARSGAKFSPPVRAAAIGAATPLLPCGLLYGVYGGALAAGSIGGGALVMVAFAVGGLPALLAAQLQTGLWRRSTGATVLIKRAVPVLAAAVLVYRAVMAEPDAPPSCH